MNKAKDLLNTGRVSIVSGQQRCKRFHTTTGIQNKAFQNWAGNAVFRTINLYVKHVMFEINHTFV